MNSPMMFGGIPIRICEHLPKTKTISWVTQRKWCRRKRFPASQYRKHSKEVACETVFMFGGAMVMSAETARKVQLQLDARSAK
ncbi:MAG TPA: hypothetical protein VF682_13280 [Pseudomonas sp.]|jgi:hypothetical protein